MLGNRADPQAIARSLVRLHRPSPLTNELLCSRCVTMYRSSRWLANLTTARVPYPPDRRSTAFGVAMLTKRYSRRPRMMSSFHTHVTMSVAERQVLKCLTGTDETIYSACSQWDLCPNHASQRHPLHISTVPIYLDRPPPIS